MTILAIVNADKEGQIESKMMKSRQMEEIREARRKQMEARQEEKKAKLVRLITSISHSNVINGQLILSRMRQNSLFAARKNDCRYLIPPNSLKVLARPSIRMKLQV